MPVTLSDPAGGQGKVTVSVRPGDVKITGNFLTIDVLEGSNVEITGTPIPGSAYGELQFNGGNSDATILPLTSHNLLYGSAFYAGTPGRWNLYIVATGVGVPLTFRWSNFGGSGISSVSVVQTLPGGSDTQITLSVVPVQPAAGQKIHVDVYW